MSKWRAAGETGETNFIKVALTTVLQNPSNVLLDTIGVSLPVDFKGVDIGQAAITVRVKKSRISPDTC